MSTRILHVVANAQSPSSGWLSELAAAWHVLTDAGCEQLLVSPAGGRVAVDDANEADEATSEWASDAARAILLARTAAPAQIDAGDFDAVVCAAGDDPAGMVHASPGVERIVRSIASHGGVVAALGHDPCAFVDLASATGAGARVVRATRAGTASETAEQIVALLGA